VKWKTDLVTSCKDLEIKSPNTNKHTNRNLKGILKTPGSPTSSCPSGQASISQPNGSNNLTMETSHASQPTTDQETPLTSFLFTCPLSHQMTHHLNPYLIGSEGCLQDLMPNFCKQLNAQGAWMTGESLPTSSATASTMKNTRKSMQKSVDSSWTPPLLSKIVPYASSDLRHQGVLKVSLTLKGWVPSPPMPSGAHGSPTTRMMMSNQVQRLITVGNDSEEEAMKWPSRISQEDD
jgi:hypothetical protein